MNNLPPKTTRGEIAHFANSYKFQPIRVEHSICQTVIVKHLANCFRQRILKSKLVNLQPTEIKFQQNGLLKADMLKICLLVNKRTVLDMTTNFSHPVNKNV